MVAITGERIYPTIDFFCQILIQSSNVKELNFFHPYSLSIVEMNYT